MKSRNYKTWGWKAAAGKCAQKNQDELIALRAYVDAICNEKKEEQAAVVRELMKVKWKEIDRYYKENAKEDDIIECLICGNKAQRGSLKIKEVECIYNGGLLERYVCSCCGAIFGPSKFSDLSQEEKDEDYYLHYLGFAEGDSTEKELRAFYMLNPTKEGIYLNYGCGAWSKSIEILRNEGYKVYGYEPYAQHGNVSPYVLTERNVLERMRFDGIFSNDVIEHLIDPIEGFLYMKSLLRDQHSKMSHSTSCYIYKHEETRFHTYFFTGNSLDYLCKKSGLKIVESVDDVEEKDFICHVFQGMDFQTNYLPLMYTQGDFEQTEKGLALRENSVLFGPYLSYSKGNLEYHLELCIDGGTDITGILTANSGKRVLKVVELVSGINVVDVSLQEDVRELEFVIRTDDREVLIKKFIQK